MSKNWKRFPGHTACMLPFFLSLSLATLAAILSCIGPKYVRPGTVVPPAFKESEDWKTAQPRDSMLRGPWWNIFSDPHLDTLEKQVAISNQTLAAAEAQYRQARAVVRASRAGYFPTITAQSSFTHTQRSATLGKSGVVLRAIASTFSDYLLDGTASWVPDIWGKVRRLVEANRALAQASAADLASATLSAQGQLAQDYFQVRILDAQKRILDSAVTAYQRFLTLTEARYTSGVASLAEVAQAQTQLKTTEARAIDVGVQRSQSEHAVAILIGKPPALFSIPAAPLTPRVPLLPPGVPSEILERRPDVAAAERRIAAANAEIGVARTAYFPNVTLTGDGGFESGALAKWFTFPSLMWSLGASAIGTIFDGGLLGAQLDQAKAAYQGSVATYRQTVLTAFQEVEDNLAALRILGEEAQAQDEAVTASRQSVALTIDQFTQGTVSALDVITTQTTELTNQETAVGLLGSRISAAVLLIEALGGGWDSSQLPSAKAAGAKSDTVGNRR